MARTTPVTREKKFRTTGTRSDFYRIPRAISVQNTCCYQEMSTIYV
jgi:hypothetical protein